MITSSNRRSAPHVVAGRPQPLEEPGPGRDESHVGGHGLDADHRNRLIDLGHDVVGRDDRVGHRPGGDTLGAHEPLLGHAGAAGHEQRVGVAVVVPGELEDPLATRDPTGETDGRHGGLGTARHEPDHVHALGPAGHLLGDPHLVLGGRAVAGAPGGGVAHRLDDGGVGVAEDRRAVALHVVDVAVALDVVDEGPLGPGNEVGPPSHRAERPDR